MCALMPELKNKGLPERKHESPSKQRRDQDVDDKIGGKTDQPVQEKFGRRGFKNEIGKNQE